MYTRTKLPNAKNQARNARAKAAKALAAYAAKPALPERQRARDRVLAYRAQARKLRYLLACHAGCSFSRAHFLGGAFDRAAKAWESFNGSTISL